MCVCDVYVYASTRVCVRACAYVCVCVCLFVHPSSHTYNNAYINYRLQFTYYNITYNIWRSTQFNIINNNTKFKDQFGVVSVTTNRNICICIFILTN